MFDIRLIKRVAIITLFFFTCFCVSSNFTFAGGEEPLEKRVMRYIQQGDYDGAIAMLKSYIEAVKDIKERKSDLAEAYYYLARTFNKVGLVKETEGNLRKVFETFPGFEKEERDFRFKDMVGKIKAEVLKDKKGKEKEKKGKVIVKKGKKKKKKKSPVLLVLGGAVVIGILAVLLSKKKETTSSSTGIGTITGVTVKFTLTFAAENYQTTHNVQIDGETILNETLTFTQHFNENHQWDDLQKITSTFTIRKNLGSFTIRHESGPNWNPVYPGERSWVGSTIYQLEIIDYTYTGSIDPGQPSLSDNYFSFKVNSSKTDPNDEWYRIKTKTITINSAPAPSVDRKTEKEKPGICEVKR